MSATSRRFPPPRSIEEHQESFIVKDANGQQLAYLCFEDEPQRQMSMKRLSRDEAFLIAVNIAKLPSMPRQPAGMIEREGSRRSTKSASAASASCAHENRPGLHASFVGTPRQTFLEAVL